MQLLLGLFLPPRHCADNFFSRFFYAAPRPLCEKGKTRCFRRGKFQLLFFFGATAPMVLEKIYFSKRTLCMSASFGVQAFTKATAFRLETSLRPRF